MLGGQLCPERTGFRNAQLSNVNGQRKIIKNENEKHVTQKTTKKREQKTRNETTAKIVSGHGVRGKVVRWFDRGKELGLVASAKGAPLQTRIEINSPAVFDVHLLVQTLEAVLQTAQGQLLVYPGSLGHP